MSNEHVNPYAVTLDQLESEAHVALEDQVTEVADAPNPGPVPVEELDRARLLGVVGDGRLRQ
jgi:hypothetical protein